MRASRLTLWPVAIAVLVLSLATAAPSWAAPVVDRGPLFNSYVERDINNSSLIGAKYTAFDQILKGNLNVRVELTGDADYQGPTGWDNWSVDYDIHFADVDGDGKADILGRNYSTGDVQVGLSDGKRFQGSTSWGDWSLDYDTRFVDINGDGKADIVGRSFTADDVQVSLSDGERFGKTTSWGKWGVEYEIYYADADGDSKVDIIGTSYNNGEVHVGLSDGEQFQDAEPWGIWSPDYVVDFADVSGDGKADQIDLSTLNDEIRVKLSDGDRFRGATIWGSWSEESETRFADVDGDGKANQISRKPSSGEVEVALSNGRRFQTPISGGNWSLDYEFYLADVNGDGKDDRIGRTPPGRVFTSPVYNPNVPTSLGLEQPCRSGGELVSAPYYSLGESFEGLPRTSSKRRCDDENIGQLESGTDNYITEKYGDCAINVNQGHQSTCAQPIEIQTRPACTSSIADLKTHPFPYEETEIKGEHAVIFEDGQVDLYTSEATVSIYGDDPDQIRRAAEAVARQPNHGIVEIPCEAPTQIEGN